MQTEHLAHVSAALAATRSRMKKTAILAECLADLNPGEVYIATSYLTGGLPQGRIVEEARRRSGPLLSNRPIAPR